MLIFLYCKGLPFYFYPVKTSSNFFFSFGYIWLSLYEVYQDLLHYMYLSWWTPRQCCLCFSRQASRSRCLSPLWSAGLPIIRWRVWWCRRWWPPPNRLCLAPSLLSQKSTDYQLFRWQTLTSTDIVLTLLKKSDKDWSTGLYALINLDNYC